MSDFVRTWWIDLSERERQEIEFAEIYAEDFGHGTDGHNRLNLIATLAAYLDQDQIDMEEE